MTGVRLPQNQLLLEISEPAVREVPGFMGSDLYLFQRLLNSSNKDLLCVYHPGKHPKWSVSPFLTHTSLSNKCTHFLLIENFQGSPYKWKNVLWINIPQIKCYQLKNLQKHIRHILPRKNKQVSKENVVVLTHVYIFADKRQELLSPNDNPKCWQWKIFCFISIFLYYHVFFTVYVSLRLTKIFR